MSPANIVLEKATVEDFQDIRRLIHEVGINPTGLDWRRFILAKDENGHMVGCGQLKVHRNGVYELASLAVAARWRKRGVASKIITYLISAAPNGWLYLTCRQNLGKFYRKFGFEVIAPEELPGYYKFLSLIARAAKRLGIINESMLVMRRWVG